MTAKEGFLDVRIVDLNYIRPRRCELHFALPRFDNEPLRYVVLTAPPAQVDMAVGHHESLL